MSGQGEPERGGLAGRIERLARQGAGLAVAAGLIARHAGGPLPRVSVAQRIAAMPCDGLPLERAVRVRWNRFMVPFIEAEGERDLAVALGAVQMHLRAGHIELLRRVASGRIAEVAGPAAIEIDRSIRSLGIRDRVPGLIAALPEATRDWAQGFVDGMNAALFAGPSPPEFAMLGIRPEAWTLEDHFTLARLFSADLAWGVQRKLLALRDRTAPSRWRALWPTLVGRALPDGGTRDVLDAALAIAIRGGSNAAAVDGSRTETGHALLSGDPHLGISLPNPWIVACLSGGGIEAHGLMLPGTPFIALGRNRDIAWGGTSLHAASSDLVDLSGVDPARFETRSETVLVRGGRKRTVSWRRSAWGPVVSDGVLFPARRGPVALRWVGVEPGGVPGGELGAMLGVMRARDRDGFRASLAGFGVPGLTMVYAGPDGVGRQVAARLPRRAPGPPGDLVAAPGQVERDWASLASGDALFGEWDPPEGFVASANEALEGREPERIPLGVFFAPETRVRRLRTLLAPQAGRRVTRGDMRALCLDCAQENLLPVRDLLLARMGNGPFSRGAARLRQAIASWDGTYARDSRGALATELLLSGTARRVLGEAGLRAVETVWLGRWLIVERLASTPLAVLARAVADAVPEASRRFRRLGHWGAAHRYRLRHVLAAVPGWRVRFGSIGFEGEGGNETLNKTGHGLVTGRHRIGFGATARYLFDLADPDGSEIVLLGGQDGWPGSEAMTDQLGLWREGRAMVLPLRVEAAEAHGFDRVSVLRPASTRSTQSARSTRSTPA